jgi:hypothetical protein
VDFVVRRFFRATDLRFAVDFFFMAMGQPFPEWMKIKYYPQSG